MSRPPPTLPATSMPPAPPGPRGADAPPSDAAPTPAPAETVFVLALRPEGPAEPWRARLLHPSEAMPAEFDSPLALVRHMARLAQRAHRPPGGRGRGGLR